MIKTKFSFILSLLLTSVARAQSIDVTSASPIEAKLASLDGRSATVQQSIVKEYSVLLDDLDQRCKEDRSTIADLSAKGVELLAEKKIAMTRLRFLQSMNASLPSQSRQSQIACAEIAAALATMINSK